MNGTAARAALAGVAAFALAACAASAPRVEQLAADSWMITVDNQARHGGQAGARARARQRAEAICAEQQRVLVETHLSSGISAQLEGGVTELNFRCLAAEDPQVAMPPG